MAMLLRLLLIRLTAVPTTPSVLTRFLLVRAAALIFWGALGGDLLGGGVIAAQLMPRNGLAMSLYE